MTRPGQSSRFGIDQTDDVEIALDVGMLDSGIDQDHSDLNVAGGANFAGGPARNVE